MSSIYPDSLQLAAKIYSSSGLTSADAAWIAARVDFLIADGSVDDIVDDMKIARPEILLLRYIATPVVSTVPLGQFKAAVYENDMPSDWFWPDGEGNKIWVGPLETAYYVLPSVGGVSGWPDFFADAVLAYIGNRAFDGVHGDIAAQRLQHYPDEYELLKDHYEDNNVLFRADQEPHIARLRSRFNDAGFFFMTNNVGILGDYFLNSRVPNIDGFNHQWIFMNKPGTYQTESQAESLMDRVDECIPLGKLILIQAGPNPNWDQEEINYCVHAYMLISKNPYTYLALDFGGAFSDLQTLFNDYGSAFETDFGQPLGDRYKEDGIWKREFVNGLLQVDLVNHTYSFGVAAAGLPKVMGIGTQEAGRGFSRVAVGLEGLPEVEPRVPLAMLDVTEPIRETQMVQADVDGSVRGRTRSIEPIRSRMPHSNRKVVRLPTGTELASELDYAVKVQAVGGSTGAAYTARHLGGGKVMIESSVADDTAEIEVTIEERTRQRA